MGMKLMRGDKIHSSLQFQGWRSRDLRQDQRLTRGARSLMRDIRGGGSSDISVYVWGRTWSMCWLCPQGTWISLWSRDSQMICLSHHTHVWGLIVCSVWIIHKRIVGIWAVNARVKNIWFKVDSWGWCHSCWCRLRTGGCKQSLYRHTQGFQQN